MFSALLKLGRRLRYWVRRDLHERELREEIEEHRQIRGAASVASPDLRAEEARAVWIRRPSDLTPLSFYRRSSLLAATPGERR